MAHHRTVGPTWPSPGSSTPTGPGSGPTTAGWCPTSCVQAMQGEPLTVYGDGSQTRSLCYVEDEVRGLLALFDSALTGPVNIGNPDEYTVLELAHDRGRPARLLLADRAPSPPDRRSHPPPPGHLGGPGRAGLGADHRAPGRAHRHGRLPGRRGPGPRRPAPAASLAAGPSTRRGPRRPTRARRGHGPHRAGNEEPGPWLTPATGRRRTRAGSTGYSLLSVIVPVFNERSTVAELFRRIRAVELPVDVEVIVVDDGSTDGTEKVLGRPRGLDGPGHQPWRQPGQGRRRPVPGWRRRAATSCSSRTPTSSTTPTDWPRLLDPVLRGKAQVVYGSRFTGERKNMLPLHWVGNRFLSLVDQRALLVDAVGHGDAATSCSTGGCSRGSPSSRTGSSSSPRSPPRSCGAGHRIYEVPISYAGREPDEGKKITWRDGFGALTALVNTGSPGRTVTGRAGRARRAATRTATGPAGLGPVEVAAVVVVTTSRDRPGPAASRPCAEGTAEVVVVDNGSRDGSVERAPAAGTPGSSRASYRAPTSGTGRRPTAVSPPPPRRSCWCATPISRCGPGAVAALAGALGRRPRLGARRTPDPRRRRRRATRRPAGSPRSSTPPATPCSASSSPTTPSPGRTSRPSWTGSAEDPRGRLGVGGLLPGPAAGLRGGGWASTSRTSCTPRTSTCAGGSAGPGGRSAYVPAAEVTHLQGVSTERHPYRMIVEHHRSLLRFAARSSAGVAPGAAAAGGARARGPGPPRLPGPAHAPVTAATGAPDAQAVGCRPIMAEARLDGKMGGARRHHRRWADLSRPDAGQLVRQPGHHLRRGLAADRVQPLPADPPDGVVGRPADDPAAVVRRPSASTSAAPCSPTFRPAPTRPRPASPPTATAC